MSSLHHFIVFCHYEMNSWVIGSHVVVLRPPNSNQSKLTLAMNFSPGGPEMRSEAYKRLSRCSSAVEIFCQCVSFCARGSDQTSVKTPEHAVSLRFLQLLPRQWAVAKGADKELVDAKTRVCDLVIESLTLSSPRGEGGERLEETLQLSWVRLRCSWEHRYDNGTDPVSL